MGQNLSRAGEATPPCVLIDANVLVANFRPGHAFRLLLDGSRTGQLDLVVPDLAIKEAANKHREQAEKAARGLDKALADLSRLEVKVGRIGPVNPDGASQAYAARLRRSLAAARARVSSTVDVPHERLIRRALERRKPFSESGAGYRDALLWEGVVAEACADRALYFCTKDTGDFSQNGALPPDLLRDLSEAGKPEDSVTLIVDLPRLVGELVNVCQVATIDVRQVLPKRISNLYDLLQGTLHGSELDRPSLRRALGDASLWGPAAMGPEQLDVADILIVDLGDELSYADVDSAHILSTGDILAVLDVGVEATVEVEIDVLGHDRSDGRPRMASTIATVRVLLGVAVDAVFSQDTMELLAVVHDPPEVLQRVA